MVFRCEHVDKLGGLSPCFFLANAVYLHLQLGEFMLQSSVVTEAK